jgi:hypothetical protein
VSPTAFGFAPLPQVNVCKVFKIKDLGPDFSKPSWLFTAVNGEGPAVAGPVHFSKSVRELLVFCLDFYFYFTE